MKLIKNVAMEPLPYHTNIVIRCDRGQNNAIDRLLEDINPIDPEVDYDIVIKPIKRSRSLNANSYYWQLLRKVSEKKNIGMTECHNRNLAEVGAALTGADGKVRWTLQRDDDYWLKLIELHLCPTDRIEERNGTIYRWYYILKPSHLMDRKEMSMLIDNLVQDAQTLGIETKTPDELARLKAAWGDR